jgi:hypothetical protein
MDMKGFDRVNAFYHHRYKSNFVYLIYVCEL